MSNKLSLVQPEASLDFLGFLRSVSCNVITCILSFLLVALGSWLGLSRVLPFLPNFLGCTFSSFVYA